MAPLYSRASPHLSLFDSSTLASGYTRSQCISATQPRFLQLHDAVALTCNAERGGSCERDTLTTPNPLMTSRGRDAASSGTRHGVTGARLCGLTERITYL